MDIISKPSIMDEWVNDLTHFMDSFLIRKSKYFETYICKNKTSRNHWVIRYPGATRGHILVDDDNIILDIVLYDTCDMCYSKDIYEYVKIVIGDKLIFDDEKLQDFRENKLVKMTDEEKESGFDNFLAGVKELNLNVNKELEILDKIRGIK